MRKNLFLWQFGGFALSSLAGTILHFLYDWTGKNPIVALVSGINESTWEHMKLLFVPLFLCALVQRRFCRDCADFWSVKLRGIVMGLALIPVLFYTYNGAVGKSPDWVNIGIFFVAAAMAFWLETRLFRQGNVVSPAPHISFTLICLIGVLFVVFTFIPPHIPLFQDPLTHTYGPTAK